MIDLNDLRNFEVGESCSRCTERCLHFPVFKVQGDCVADDAPVIVGAHIRAGSNEHVPAITAGVAEIPRGLARPPLAKRMCRGFHTISGLPG